MIRQLRLALRTGIVTEPAAADPELEVLGHRLGDEVHRMFGRSLHIRQVDAGSCNGCELEISGLTGPHYDLERFMIRLDEARESARLIATLLRGLPDGPAHVPLGDLRAGEHATVVVEAWRGPIWHWVLAEGPATRARVKVADPSFRNWPALECAVLENIVPDFPLVNKSFNLSYSGNDL